MIYRTIWKIYTSTRTHTTPRNEITINFVIYCWTTIQTPSHKFSVRWCGCYCILSYTSIYWIERSARSLLRIFFFVLFLCSFSLLFLPPETSIKYTHSHITCYVITCLRSSSVGVHNATNIHLYWRGGLFYSVTNAGKREHIHNSFGRLYDWSGQDRQRQWRWSHG